MSTQSAPTGDPASPGEPSPGPTPPEGPGERFIPRRVLLGTGAALLAGSGVSATWAYDRFLREKVQVSDVSAAESTAGAATTAVLATDGSYSSTGYTSSTTTLTLISTATGTGSEALAWYAAVVEITDATVLRAAFA